MKNKQKGDVKVCRVACLELLFREADKLDKMKMKMIAV